MGVLSNIVQTGLNNPVWSFVMAVVFYGVGDYYSTKAALDAGMDEDNKSVRRLLEKGGWSAFAARKMQILGVLGLVTVAPTVLGDEYAMLAGGMNLMAAGAGVIATVANYGGVIARSM